MQANTAAVGLRRLIRALRRSAGERVVVLVDEYDKPILDALATPDLARANRDFLHGVYSIIKACDADLAFVLLTGVSRFSKVSIFSGLNNLADITLDPRYSTLCGYTDDDLDTTFADQLRGIRDGHRAFAVSLRFATPKYRPCASCLSTSERKARLRCGQAAQLARQ